MGYNDIFTQLSVLNLAVYAPISYILPSRLRKYEEIYDTQVEGGRGKLRQADREHSLQALMTTNLLKRLESSVAAFRLTLRSLGANISHTLGTIGEFERTGRGESVSDHLAEMSDFDPEDDDLSGLDEFTVGKKVEISLADMDLPSWKHDLAADLSLIEDLIASTDRVKPADDLPLDLKPTGGGGTDFRPPFEWVEEKDVTPACLIYLTDLVCRHFPRPPAYPVLWASTTDRTAPFGETLRIRLV